MPTKPAKKATAPPKAPSKAKGTPVAGTPASAGERASAIRLCCFDVDGSLTDGRLVLDTEGGEGKAFHVHDGLGLRLLEDNGIVVALVTARDSRAAVARGRELGLRNVFVGVKDKLACVRHLAGQLGLELHQVAFFGDDLPDLRAFVAVGLAAGPADTHPWVRGHVHWLGTREGGRGAAREFCDFILEAQGLRQRILDGLLP
jgi:3-deoxy-D-manno-octulosonate 8-phosphate phosphatase (KDO 8-P phosphatase)